MKATFLFTLLALISLTVNSQEQKPIATESLAADLKKLIADNSTIPNYINLASKEAIYINTNATASQVIEITSPYLDARTINTKQLCLHLLADALFKKTKTSEQRQPIVEAICRNYLGNDYDLMSTENILLQLHEKDFTPAAKKYVAALTSPAIKFSYSMSARLSAVAQIKKSIPVLWTIANLNISTFSQTDVDVMASLARLGETRAGTILCNYYNSIKNKVSFRYLYKADHLAFSLDKNVLNCLISDFKTIDTTIHFRDSDTFDYPSQRLAGHIFSMLKNYPYAKNNYEVEPKQFWAWLDATKTLDLHNK